MSMIPQNHSFMWTKSLCDRRALIFLKGNSTVLETYSMIIVEAVQRVSSTTTTAGYRFRSLTIAHSPTRILIYRLKLDSQ